MQLDEYFEVQIPHLPLSSNQSVMGSVVSQITSNLQLMLLIKKVTDEMHSPSKFLNCNWFYRTETP